MFTPRSRGGARPVQPLLSGDMHPPVAPKIPQRRKMGQQGQQGWTRDTHRKQHCSWSPELRFKETQDAKFSPNHCGRVVAAAAAWRSWEGGGGVGEPEARLLTPTSGLISTWPPAGQRPHPTSPGADGFLPSPCLRCQCPNFPSWANLTHSGSNGTSSRKPAPPSCGQMPLSSHSLSVGQV